MRTSLAVALHAGTRLSTLEKGQRSFKRRTTVCNALHTNTNAIADFDARLDILANPDGFSDDLMADDDRVRRGEPAAP